MKRGEMDGEAGSEFMNAVELAAVDQFGEEEWRAFFAVVRYVRASEGADGGEGSAAYPHARQG